MTKSTTEQATNCPHGENTRSLKAAFWLAGSNIGSQLLRLLSNLVLTRLLLPEAFGLVAAVNVLYFALVMFSDFGVWQSVVKSGRGDDPRFLGTAWSIQMLRGLLLGGLVLLLALFFFVAQSFGLFSPGTVYSDHRMAPMMAVFALCALVQGMESMKIACAERELRGWQLARLELSSQIGTVVVTVGLALLTRSVWALLLGTLFGGVLRTVLSHTLVSGSHVRPCWDKVAAAEIIGFGKWIFLSSIIGFLAGHGEKLLLAATLSTTSFGIFSIAGNLLAAIAGIYSTVNGRVIFPTLSRALREKSEVEVARVYARVQKIADLLLGVCSGGLLLSGQWLVRLLYDERYQDAGWMLQLLGLSLLAMRHQVVEQMMFARSQPSWVSANNLLRAATLCIAIPLGFSMGGEHGAVVGIIVSQFASWPLSLRWKHEQGLLSWETEKWWLPAFALGMAGGLLVDGALSAWHG